MASSSALAAEGRAGLEKPAGEERPGQHVHLRANSVGSVGSRSSPRLVVPTAGRPPTLAAHSARRLKQQSLRAIQHLRLSVRLVELLARLRGETASAAGGAQRAAECVAEPPVVSQMLQRLHFAVEPHRGLCHRLLGRAAPGTRWADCDLQRPLLHLVRELLTAADSPFTGTCREGATRVPRG